MEGGREMEGRAGGTEGRRREEGREGRRERGRRGETEGGREGEGGEKINH